MNNFKVGDIVKLYNGTSIDVIDDTCAMIVKKGTDFNVDCVYLQYFYGHLSPHPVHINCIELVCGVKSDNT